MKNLSLITLVLIASCVSDKKVASGSSEDCALIEREIIDYYQALSSAYNGISVNTDSLIDKHFDKNVYYVTYWGTVEPIDSTKSRLRQAIRGMKNYQNHTESMNIKVYGDGAYAFFILRQNYVLNGTPMDEYLPTTLIFERRDGRWVVVHSQRSADFQTIQRFMQAASKRLLEFQEEGTR